MKKIVETITIDSEQQKAALAETIVYTLDEMDSIVSEHARVGPGWL
jgi:hypothetical protein